MCECVTNSMDELPEALQNFSIHSTDMETTENQTGYQAEPDELIVFQAQEKPKPKKRRRLLDWKRGRKKKPVAQKVKKTVEPKGKEVLGESSSQALALPPWEELDRKLANCDIFGPADENLVNVPVQTELPINLEPAILEPIVNPLALPGPIEEWWTNDWQFQNLINNPNPYYPQFEPAPDTFPPMSPENVAELHRYGEELVDTGNRSRSVGENIYWKYDEREFHF
ncbi:hypothetical protein HanHA300_Chr01g0025061 [Helianthus annuus]|nr:hypothetical protein HanHA300_Chr01g0025061 [Helianthus annuus]